jgi:hypothetical protein
MYAIETQQKKRQKASPRLTPPVHTTNNNKQTLTLQEEAARFGVRRDALQERERVAHAVARVRRERGRRQQRVDRHDLLQERRHGPKRVPQIRGELGEIFALFAEFQERVFARRGVDELVHVGLDLVGHVCWASAISRFG